MWSSSSPRHWMDSEHRKHEALTRVLRLLLIGQESPVEIKISFFSTVGFRSQWLSSFDGSVGRVEDCRSSNRLGIEHKEIQVNTLMGICRNPLLWGLEDSFSLLRVWLYVKYNPNTIASQPASLSLTLSHTHFVSDVKILALWPRFSALALKELLY